MTPAAAMNSRRLWYVDSGVISDVGMSGRRRISIRLLGFGCRKDNPATTVKVPGG
jgi:hypothetical protein